MFQVLRLARLALGKYSGMLEQPQLIGGVLAPLVGGAIGLVSVTYPALRAAHLEPVEALRNAVVAAYPKLSHRYYELKRKWLGLDTLQVWDRNAPLPMEDDRLVHWDEARKVVSEAYADFDPRIHSEAEIQRFCRAFMTQLARHIGPDTDIPAGDIGVSAREIAYLFDQYRAISGNFSGVITGKDPVFGGSCFREQATGYGCVYFARHVMAEKNSGLDRKRCAISGAGNVALHTAEKLLDNGARVISLSERRGTVHFKDGLTEQQLTDIKQDRQARGDLKSLAERRGWDFHEGRKPWPLETDLAFACATQNELDAEDAARLVDNGCEAVFEGANMPCTGDAVRALREAGVTLAPSKAVNAGGVAVSGLEISQNRARRPWDGDRVNRELERVMEDIHSDCVEYGRSGDDIDYKKGANIAAFVQLSKAIRLYGLA